MKRFAVAQMFFISALIVQMKDWSSRSIAFIAEKRLSRSIGRKLPDKPKKKSKPKAAINRIGKTTRTKNKPNEYQKPSDHANRMQIKARIKRIESRVKQNYSPFCACESYKGKIYPRFEMVLERNGVQTIKNPIADVCERCGKPIEKQQLIIQFV